MSAWPTPIADQALRNPVGIPPHVDRWLRGIEMRARALHARLEQACRVDEPLPALVAMRDELAAFLGPGHESALRRLLRRPLARLALHLPAARAFDAHVRRMLERGQAAIELQAKAEWLRGEIDQVVGRYGALPYFTAAALAAAGLTPAGIARARRPGDVDAMQRRLARVVHRLAELQQHLPPGTPAPSAAPSASPPAEPTVPELRAALALRLKRREAAHPPADTTHALRRTAARHLRALGSAAAWSSPASQPSHSVAERLAIEAMRPGDSLAPEGEDVDLWSGLLGSATAALYGLPGEGWQPQVTLEDETRGEPDASDTGSILYAVPIDDTFVCLTPDHPAPARVRSRRPRAGGAVECRIFSEGTISGVARELDVDPLFAGITPAVPGWYTTGAAARVRVFAEDAGEWFARIERRGTAKLLATPAWQDSVDDAGALRIVAAESGMATAAVPVGAAGDGVRFPGGVTHEVRTPFADHPWSWLKTPAEPGRLDAERALFQHLAHAGGEMALRPLGRARLRPRDPEGFVYARPFAFRPAHSPPLRAWMERGGGYAFIRAVARVAAAAHAAGFAVGIYHPDAFAFRAEWDARENAFHPAAVLVEAPCAARIGEPFPACGAADLIFPRLRFTGAAPALARGNTATAEGDAVGFALLVLELLAKEPLPVAALPWDRIPEMVSTHADCFARPAFAAKVAACLDSADGGSRLVTLIHGLAVR